MSSIYLIESFWFLATIISTILVNRLKISPTLMEILLEWSLPALCPILIGNRFFLPSHLLVEPVLDDHIQDIGKKNK
jgi:hypothetical protein